MSYPKILIAPPGPKARDIVERDHALISPSFGRVYRLVIKSSDGCIITNVDGNKFIDMNAGLAVLNIRARASSLEIFEEYLNEVEAED